MKKLREYRMFTDGSYDDRKQGGGISCVLYRGFNPKPVFFLRKKVTCCSPLEAEFMALECGLRIAKKKNIHGVDVCCDAQTMVDQVDHLMFSKSKQCASVAQLLHDVDGKLMWIPREQNKVADALSSLSDTRCSSQERNTLETFCLV